jgi:hypothetical protein
VATPAAELHRDRAWVDGTSGIALIECSISIRDLYASSVDAAAKQCDFPGSGGRSTRAIDN